MSGRNNDGLRPRHEGLRVAFRAEGAPLRWGEGVTPAGQISAAIQAVIDRWNERMPSRRARVLNAGRRNDLVAALAVWRVQELLDVIDWYAGQSWNRTRAVWQSFDHFLDMGNLTAKYEAMESERERAERGPAADPRVRKLTEDLAETTRVRAENESLLERFTAYAPDEQHEMIAQAARELAELRGQAWADRLRRDMACWPIRMQVLVILKRRLAAPRNAQRGEQ